ncbi:hypothetical protein D3C78_1854360 [compost metagenome]
MNYAKELFIEAGMASEAAELKSSLLYHYYLGWYERHKYEQVEEQERDRHIKIIRTQLLGV